jgi:hypothetical protein
METDPVVNLMSAVSSPPAGYRFPREVIAVAVRWYLRYGLSYRDVEELLAERGIEVDHVTVYRWVQTFTSEFIDAARSTEHDNAAVKAGRSTIPSIATMPFQRWRVRAPRLLPATSSPTRARSPRGFERRYA